MGLIPAIIGATSFITGAIGTYAFFGGKAEDNQQEIKSTGVINNNIELEDKPLDLNKHILLAMMVIIIILILIIMILIFLVFKLVKNYSKDKKKTNESISIVDV